MRICFCVYEKEMDQSKKIRPSRKAKSINLQKYAMNDVFQRIRMKIDKSKNNAMKTYLFVGMRRKID